MDWESAPAAIEDVLQIIHDVLSLKGINECAWCEARVDLAEEIRDILKVHSLWREPNN